VSRDLAGNSIKKAKRINLRRGSFQFRDTVSVTDDSTDLYQVKVGSRSRLSIKVSRQQRTGNADVELYQLTRNKRSAFRQIGRRHFDELSRSDIRSNLDRVGRSRRNGRKNERLTVTVDPGIYYVRVFAQSGQTRYRLSAASKPAPLPPTQSQPQPSPTPPTIISPSPSPRPITPIIQVSSPNGGESLQAGESVSIKWTDQLSESVRIDLFSNGSKVRTITSKTSSDGEFQWDIPSNLQSRADYTIRIGSRDNDAVFDDSDAAFSIERPVQADPSESFNIRFDYRFDTQGWFTPKRKAALESAAKFWEDIIQEDFESLPAGTLIYVENPEQEGVFEEFAIDQAIDDVVIFAGSRKDDALAEGGPSALYFPGSTLDKRFTGDDFEPWSGFVTFNRDSNWFFDDTPMTDGDLPDNKLDFLSVAIHEIGHVLGYGTSDAFSRLISGTSFVGSASQAENGGEPVPLAADLSHVKDDYEFGNSGELVFDPILRDGDRTLPTRLDVAALQDIGYEVDYSKTFQN